MNIIIGSSHLWRSSTRVGIHAFGEYFASRGCHVEWWTIPFSMIHFIKPTHLAVKWQRLKIAMGHPYQEEIGTGSITNRVPLTLVHPVPNIPILASYYVSKNYLIWSIPPFFHPLHRMRAHVNDILLLDSGGINLYYPARQSARLVIYRLNDLVAEFPNQARGRIQSEKEVIKNADLVLPVSQSLYDEAVRIRKTSSGVHLLPNGVHLNAFKIKHPPPIEYRELTRPRILFVGALSSWFDWNLIIEVARQRPHYSFIMIGGGKVPENTPINIHILGMRPHNQIPAYLQHADAGIIPFKDVPLIQRMEKPLKFYEYQAAGLPVVSVPYGGLTKMKPYAFFGRHPDEFARAIDSALKTTNSKREQFKQDSLKYSWDTIFAQFENILQDTR